MTEERVSELDAVRAAAAAAVSAHRRSGSEEALAAAESELDVAVRRAVEAGHDADSGAAAPLDGERLRRALGGERSAPS